MHTERIHSTPRDKNTAMLQQTRQLGSDVASWSLVCFFSFFFEIHVFKIPSCLITKLHYPHRWAATACDDYLWAFFKGQPLFPSSPPSCSNCTSHLHPRGERPTGQSACEWPGLPCCVRAAATEMVAFALLFLAHAIRNEKEGWKQVKLNQRWG